MIGESGHEAVPVMREAGTALLSGIEFRGIEIEMLCAEQALADCTALDLTPLLSAAAGLRNPAQLARALDGAGTLPDTTVVPRIVVGAEVLMREVIVDSSVEAREFSVTWYDARQP